MEMMSSTLTTMAAPNKNMVWYGMVWYISSLTCGPTAPHHEIVRHEIVRHEIVRHEIVRHEFVIF